VRGVSPIGYFAVGLRPLQEFVCNQTSDEQLAYFESGLAPESESILDVLLYAQTGLASTTFTKLQSNLAGRKHTDAIHQYTHDGGRRQLLYPRPTAALWRGQSDMNFSN
jgi:hypothetical protein